MALSPHLEQLVAEIKAAHPQGLNLDELSDALLGQPVTYADIDEIIGALEDAGFDLEGPTPDARPEELARVLAAARALAAETGHKPGVDEIAARTGLAPAVVRRALRLGQSMPGAKS